MFNELRLQVSDLRDDTAEDIDESCWLEFRLIPLMRTAAGPVEPDFLHDVMRTLLSSFSIRHLIYPALWPHCIHVGVDPTNGLS